ncbi:MAG: hypothetical protein LBB41_00275 [Prevotellaceae bacterium]|jgi:hypothetical protein|nr:hypothetical protein [Prevotellaceae bacterium]
MECPYCEKNIEFDESDFLNHILPDFETLIKNNIEYINLCPNFKNYADQCRKLEKLENFKIYINEMIDYFEDNYHL